MKYEIFDPTFNKPTLLPQERIWVSLHILVQVQTVRCIGIFSYYTNLCYGIIWQNLLILINNVILLLVSQIFICGWMLLATPKSELSILLSVRCEGMSPDRSDNHQLLPCSALTLALLQHFPSFTRFSVSRWWSGGVDCTRRPAGLGTDHSKRDSAMWWWGHFSENTGYKYWGIREKRNDKLILTQSDFWIMCLVVTLVSQNVYNSIIFMMKLIWGLRTYRGKHEKQTT